MKHLSRFALVAWMAAAALGTAAAQTPPPPPAQDGPAADGKQCPKDRVQHRLDMLTKKLDLTQAQQDKIKPILTDADTQAKAIFDDESLSRRERFGKLKDLREDTRGKIRPILTADQQKTFDAMKEHGFHHPPQES